MKYCPNPECNGLAKFRIISEYNDSATVCADCNAPLVAGAAPDTLPVDKPDPTPDLKLVAVAAVKNELDVVLIESLLADADIPYLVQGEGIQDLFGIGRLVRVNPVTGAVKFLVAEDNAKDARQVLADFQPEDPV